MTDVGKKMNHTSYSPLLRNTGKFGAPGYTNSV